MNITIRLALPADIPDIVNVVTQSFETLFKDILPDKYFAETNAKYPALFNFITNENTTHYVVQKDNIIIGVTCIMPPQDEDIGDNCYEFHGLHLHPDYFGQSIDITTMNLIFDLIRNLGKTSICVWVYDKNIHFIELYEKCGFVADGKTKTFDAGEILDAYRMKKNL